MSAKQFVFVLMPFDSSFDDIYKLGIKATCEELNTYCERVDEQIFEENILDRIYNQINKADIIVADLTGKNPNVFYETGYAHALNKKVILLTQRSEDIPFDLKHYAHIIYDGKILKLKEELKKRIQWFINHPSKGQLPNEFNIELFINGEKLEDGKTITVEDKFQTYYGATNNARTGVKVKVDLYNAGTTIFDSLFKIGIIVKNEFSRNSNKDDKQRIVKIDGDTFLHLSKDFTRIYPSAWDYFELTLLSDEYQDMSKTALPITVRLFTEIGTKDYNVNLVYPFVSDW